MASDGIRPEQRAVLRALARIGGAPLITTIISGCFLSDAATCNAMGALCSKGLVERVSRADGQLGYRLTVAGRVIALAEAEEGGS